jgi:hypothetical protein
MRRQEGVRTRISLNSFVILFRRPDIPIKAIPGVTKFF